MQFSMEEYANRPRHLPYDYTVRGDGGETYSVDNLILDFKMRHTADGWADEILMFLSWDFESNFWHKDSWQVGSFRNQFVFKISADKSFWLGVGLNDGTGKLINRVRLDFNPNKVGREYLFRRVFNRIFSLAVRSPSIVRFDLAIDFPVLRQNVFMVKDSRLYEETRRSASDRTQYLGQRNAHGRCKLYNKQVESSLSFPLTRLEITIGGEDMNLSGVRAIWPLIYYVDDYQLCFSDIKLTDTDMFILRTILLDTERLQELSRKKREKFRLILADYTRTLALNENCYKQIVSYISVYSQLLFTDYVDNPWTGEKQFIESSPGIGMPLIG